MSKLRMYWGQSADGTLCRIMERSALLNIETFVVFYMLQEAVRILLFGPAFHVLLFLASQLGVLGVMNHSAMEW